MFKNLLSCHKSRKKDGDDDDLPYSPTPLSSKMKKNAIGDLTLTSTPNQFLHEKNRDNELMDVKNNNKSLKKLEDTLSSIEKSNDISINFNLKNESSCDQQLNLYNESFKQNKTFEQKDIKNLYIDSSCDNLDLNLEVDDYVSCDNLKKDDNKFSNLNDNFSKINLENNLNVKDNFCSNFNQKSNSNSCNDLNKPFDNYTNIAGSLKNHLNNFDKNSLSDNNSAKSVFIDKNYREVLKKDDKSFIKATYNEPNLNHLKTEDDKSENSLMMKICKTFRDSSSSLLEHVYEKPVIFKESHMVYRMESKPRGLCIIVNNATDFTECLRIKDGFHKEYLYLKELFESLDFKVKTYESIKAMDIYDLTKKEKNSQEFNLYDAFVFIFLGHGNNSFLIGKDKVKIEVELVTSFFNNHNCPYLHGKPKIFILHTCSGSCDNFFEPLPPSSTRRQKNPLKKNENFSIIPTWTDTVIIYSSFENENLHYSSFVKEFGKTICSKAYNSSLQEILLETNRQIMNNENYDNPFGFNFIYRGFNKDFYFNP